MENILKRIKEYYPVSEDSLNALKHCFRQQVFPPKINIIRAGYRDKQVYFIEKGITRSYIQYNGKDITTWFSVEGDATCGSWDLYHNKAGFEYVETLEETLTYAIPIEKLNGLYKSHIDIANWMRVLQQENFLQLQDIHISRLNLSAQERYEKLLKEYPDICRRVNLGYIASFLGITQPSLSRIRANY
ncbi:cyclic nucleotide-binding domain-containing protein [Bacteroides thetaiotaomicron]|uniref:Crp/Fnr family transcriptional regulator n=1 Tax=Bacteroides thetaiotaomicron TaxID=818 RepID=UPI0018A19548|nr:cyclic nucleotide-binding domain-containing protein [Bacteroides thetaiotaomicron]MBV4310063.1 cyclic nucleotide-binding domain-containing protein [Bacteroides thetaiotaomicron]MBV4328979.1 cyclic nucleotide-binding domain-containing protein [Bacteroides thetaiotaomicron]MCB7383712.1 cyclic nucleotide-binding domain-containing protein [Bacteroides thetaiotaomicron]MCG4882881.1 cyclic nucleotide-binding domain-containing protein [Bacteroides thetaiotaomicron]MCQ5248805.1 cyclic nucleotide-bi